MSQKRNGAEEVTEAQLLVQLTGDENRALRGQLAKFIAARRRCQSSGYGRVALVSEFHASRAMNSIETSEKEAE